MNGYHFAALWGAITGSVALILELVFHLGA